MNWIERLLRGKPVDISPISTFCEERGLSLKDRVYTSVLAGGEVITCESNDLKLTISADYRGQVDIDIQHLESLKSFPVVALLSYAGIDWDGRYFKCKGRRRLSERIGQMLSDLATHGEFLFPLRDEKYQDFHTFLVQKEKEGEF